ncbi:uncharacterized protein LOC117299925 isoform X2 [Asterias rubens]|uniref:uncharacterized protein LOC117299925 isoform X2 n=1 Tax=Asterias rubens TaxID=7604 RepID=UPI001455B81F|nr:uncharacterized protein LOC117299925 isoform X2 [Asterias rubens]
MNRLSSLQALQTICCSVSSFLGPNERLKCILEDDEDGHLVSSCCELMCHLDIEHPVGHLAMEACASHQKMHGTGSTTLMTMAGFWAAEIQLLLTQGVPIPAIIRYGDECLEQCLDALETITVPCSNLTIPKTQTSLVETPLTRIEDVHKTYTGGDRPISLGDKPHMPSQKSQSSDFHERKLHSSTTGHLTAQRHALQYPPDRFNSTGYLKGECLADRMGASSLKTETSNLEDSQKMCRPSEKSSFLQFHPSEDEDGFQEVNFTISDSQQPVCLEQMKAKSKEDAQVEADDNEDEVSWFFEREDEHSEYTLENHLSDLELLSTGCPESLSLLTDTHLSLVDFKDTSARQTHSLVGTTTNTEVDEIVQVCAEDGGETSDEESDEFDSCFPPEDEKDALPRDSIMSKSEGVKDDHQSRKPSAIQDSIHKLLQAKQNKIAQERTTKVQNNSRHFRTFETVTDQNSAGSEVTYSIHGIDSALESEKISERVEASQSPANQLTASGNHGYIQTNSHDALQCDVALETTAPQETKTPDDAVQDLLKAKHKKAAATRLTNVRNRSRHFNVTLGQNNYPEMTLPPGITEPSLRNLFLDEKMHFLSKERSGVAIPPSRPHFATNLGGVEEPDMLNLGFGLSHGADVEMRMVMEAFQMQAAHHQLSNTEMIFDLNRISVCTIQGPAASESHLESGALVKTDNIQLPSITAASTGGSIQALIVNGDATPNFRHKGFKKTTKVKVFTEGTRPAANQENSWLRDVIKILQELNIKLIILKGCSDDDLLDYCLTMKVILLQNVPYRTLQALGEACLVPILKYIGDATMSDVACGITIAGLESGWVDRARVSSNAPQRAVYARIFVKGKLLQTGVLSNPVVSLVTASEVRFWKCAHRLKDMVQSGRCLPGAGVPERTAMKRLLKMKGLKCGHNTSISCYREPITSAFSNGFVAYKLQILKNMGRVTDLSHEKTCILHGIQGDSSEPVYASFIQSDPHQQSEPGIHVFEYTSNSNETIQGYGLDQTGSSQSELELTELDDIITDGSSKFHETHKNNLSSSTGMVINPKTRTQQKLPYKRNFSEKLASFEGRDVYDSYSAKRAAWEGAWVLLKTALRVDAHIVTGLQESHQHGSSINNVNKVRAVIL